MNCESVKNVLDLYAEKRLGAGWTRAVAAHWKSCAACARELDALAPLRARPARAVQAPKDLLQALETLAAGTATPLPSSLSPFTWRGEGEGPAAANWYPLNGRMPVLAAALSYAAILMLLSVAGPGVPSQRFETPAAPEALP